MEGKALQSAVGRVGSPHTLNDRDWCKGRGTGVEPLLQLCQWARGREGGVPWQLLTRDSDVADPGKNQLSLCILPREKQGLKTSLPLAKHEGNKSTPAH